MCLGRLSGSLLLVVSPDEHTDQKQKKQQAEDDSEDEREVAHVTPCRSADGWC